MQFVMFMIPKDYCNTAPDFQPNLEEMAAMGRYNEELQAAGVLREVNGLTPPSAGDRIKFGDGKPTLQHGPFFETVETVGGYWLLELASQQEAIDWAMKCPAMPGDTIEIRRIEDRF